MDECEQACRRVHDKEFEPTEASVSDGSDDDDVCGRNETESSKLSLSGMLVLEFEADDDSVAGNMPEVDCRHRQIFQFTKPIAHAPTFSSSDSGMNFLADDRKSCIGER